MNLHCALGNAQMLGDLPIAEPLAQQAKHRILRARQNMAVSIGSRTRLMPWRSFSRNFLVAQAFNNGGLKFGKGSTLAKKPRASRSERHFDLRAVRDGRQHQDGNARTLRLDQANQGKPTHSRKDQVHQDKVERLGSGQTLDGCVRISGFRHFAHARHLSERLRQRLTDQ